MEDKELSKIGYRSITSDGKIKNTILKNGIWDWWFVKVYVSLMCRMVFVSSLNAIH